MAVGDSSEVPGAIRLIVRMWGAFSGLLCVGFGIFVMITITASCLAMGALMISTGLMVVMLEAPILCFKIEAITKLSEWIERHLRFWMRAFIYLALSLPAIIVCTELSTFIGSGAVIVTAGLYGVMAIGKKGQAPPVEPKTNTDVEMKESLVDSKGDPKEVDSPS